ncbi:MAG: 2-phospho-L-lactate transferase [Planctomycetes bacterium]|nr:2-phospho-L-lactate transferase [Planctomycetota bacterium]
MSRRLLLALAGGVGGAKLAFGLARVLPPDALTIVVNTGDDEVFWGLHVSPDLDTVMYTLAGDVNPGTGWGLRDDTFYVLEALARLGIDTWFRLGDRDLATHIRRTELLRAGHALTQVTQDLCRRFGVSHAIVPMSDNPVRTVVDTDLGVLSFQEYFVRHRCVPRVRALRFDGAETAKPSPAFVEAIQRAAAVVLCPSNPFLSLAPILALPGVKEGLTAVTGPKIAISPIIAGKAVKGPAAKLLEELTAEPATCVSVARMYRGLCTHFVIDREDEAHRSEVEAFGYTVVVTRTLMETEEDKVALARTVCVLAGVLA